MFRIETGYEMPEFEIERGYEIPRKMGKKVSAKQQARTAAKRLRHGCTKHPLYSVWSGMRSRCNNPNCGHFHRYGGRGITICSEWDSAQIFIEWAVKAGWKPGLQLDRTNNDGNYCPENCRFVTALVNSNNRSYHPFTSTEYEGIKFYRKLKKKRKYHAFIKYDDSAKHLGYYETIGEAITARNKYIIKNKLPIKLQFIMEDSK